MLKVQSLKRVVITQVATILVPLVVVIAFLLAGNTQRTAELDRLTRAGVLMGRALDRYTTFANGAVDALDSGRLSKPALGALTHAREALLATVDRPVEIDRAADAMASMAQVLAGDSSLRALLPLQQQVGELRNTVLAEQRRREALVQQGMQRSIAASHRDTQLAAVLSLFLLTLTLLFVRRMIRDLSEPLAFAVSVADRIARRDPVADAEFHKSRDVGNLVQSLGSMNRHLRIAQDEVQSQQCSLEIKLRELSESRASLNEAQGLAQMGNWHWEVGTPQASWSDHLYRVLGHEPGECPPNLNSFLALLGPDQADALLTQVRELLREPGGRVGEWSVQIAGRRRTLYLEMSSKADGSGRVHRLHGIAQDVTARREAERELRRLALYDNLTGLPNRAHFRDRLDNAIALARRSGATLATLFIDLDRFKRINDTLGHAAGDHLLKEAALRLQRAVRDGDELGRDGVDASPEAVARLGGDEFTVTLVNLRHPQDAARVAQRILHELTQPLWVGGSELVVTASVGIAVFPRDGDNAEALIKNADAAMYRAKELGRNTYQFCADDLNSAAVAKLSLENELRRALERGQFVLHYQPKVDVDSGHFVGVEALIRWQHPQWGLMAPGRFIGVAEEMGLIAQIGDWVLEAACAQLAAWRDAGLPPLSMAINLASPSFRKADLVHQVGAVLAAHRIEPMRLQLEATESIVMCDADTTLHTLRQLRELGVKLAIDDFGTGYSSLSYLRRFPIDQLKIDRSFVQDMTVNRDDAAIASAIVSLGKSLKLELVAEGVETLAQARALRELGCTVMQGYYFSRPVAAAEIDRLLRARADFSRAVIERLEGLTAPMPLLLA